ncbi:MAG: hypothetical protein DRJ42_29985 [Deltaproteobacteria bacterium]|nr:MAG: hypothetical protein DRJ42_29985 [Deltaproteobacteria bacterium]
MSDDASKKRDRAIEREARMGRKFTVANAIGNEGAGYFKGESMVPKLTQAMAELENFIDRHVRDSSGVLCAMLKRHVRTSETIVGAHLEDPRVALDVLLGQVLGNDAQLYEFVRQVDAEWGRVMQERPHFQQPGEEAHPDDEHTHQSVRLELEALRSKLRETP